MNKDIIFEYGNKYDSFYIYDKSEILKRKAELKEKFKGIDFIYSMKCNSFLPVTELIFKDGFGADSASLREAETAYNLGVKPEDNIFSAPGKREKDIEKAIGICTITADSVNEIDIINKISEKKGIVSKIGVRINPDFTFDGDKPSPSKFGIEADDFFRKIPKWKQYKNIEIIGIHTHLKSQELMADKIAEYYKKVLFFCQKVSKALGRDLDFINVGSGIGICYSSEDKPVDLDLLGKVMTDMAKKYRENSPKTRIIIETGRFLTGNAGIYVTRALDKKSSWGKIFVILHNTLNGFIRPSLANAIEKFYGKEEDPFMYEPLYTKRNSFEILVLNDEKETETVSLVGNLCTSTDEVVGDINLQKINVGDLVAFTNAGAYSAVLSPNQFSSQEKPVEILV